MCTVGDLSAQNYIRIAADTGDEGQDSRLLLSRKRYGKKILTELNNSGQIWCPDNTFEIASMTGAANTSGSAIMLTSSTQGSSKKFKITVDDNGTLSATEVTS